MRHSKMWRLFAVLLAFGLIAAACGDSDDDDSAPATTAAPAADDSSDEEMDDEEMDDEEMSDEEMADKGTLTVGLAYGVTDAALETITAVAVTAVETVETLAEAAGMDIEVIIEDTAGDPVQGVDAANKLVAAGAHCILGEARSAVTTPIVAVSAEAAVPQISWGSTSPALTTIADDDFFFRSVLSDAAQGVVAGNYVHNTVGAQTAVIVNQNDPYGVGLAGAFAAQFTAAGGEVLETIAVDTGTVDLSAEVDAVVDLAPDVIYTVLFAPEFIPFVVELDQAAPEMVEKMFLADAQATEDASDGIEDLVAGIAGMRPAGSDLAAFATFFEGESGEAPQPFTEFSFDAAVLCVAAAAAADAYDGTAIRDEIRDVSSGGTEYGFSEVTDMITAIMAGEDVDYVGAGSNLDIDENGDVSAVGATYTVWTYNDDGTVADGELITFEG